tara:strand:- start:4199 stop:5329 length:1131 start_codon:yes stop_codon:yes gene_type:complete
LDVDDLKARASVVRHNFLAELKHDPMEFMAEFELSQEEIDMMLDAEFIIPDLAISSQITVVAGKPGCGKTTILTSELRNLTDYNIMYINMDCGAADVKHWRRLADEGGYRLITPQFNGAAAISQLMDNLARLSSSDVSLARYIIVIDTLKKVGDLMNKGAVKRLMGMLRALTAKQATVICAAHVNKHRDPSGKLVFEGVGDIEADCDNLLYLEKAEEPDGTKITTSTPSDKVRGVFNKRSWRLMPDRTVIALGDPIDVIAINRAEEWREADAIVITRITEAMQAGHRSQTDLFSYCQTMQIGQRQFRRTLDRYTQGEAPNGVTPLWERVPQFRNNEMHYFLLGGGVKSKNREQPTNCNSRKNQDESSPKDDESEPF